MQLSKRTRLGAATVLAIGGGAVFAAPSMAVHQTVTGLTSETPSRIVQFAVGAPGTLINGPSAITFPAGATDTNLIGLDYRPRSTELFGMGSQGTVYTLTPPASFPGNWTATQITPTVTNQFTGTPAGFGFDFNPAADRIRIVDSEDSDGTTAPPNNNFRYRPDTGAPAVAFADGDLAYAVGDPNFGTQPDVVAAAYDQNIDTTPSTTIFDIDSGVNRLVRQGGVNGTPTPNAGALTTIGALTPPTGPALDIEPDAGFDIEGGTGTAYASLRTAADLRSTFFRIDLTNGNLLSSSPSNPTPAAIGPVGTPPIESVSLVPTSVLRFASPLTEVAENGGSATVTVVREGPLNRPTTVTVDTEIAAGDTATAADFTDIGPTMLEFPTGNARQSFTVPITDDTIDEPGADETFTVRLSMPNVASNLQSPPTAQVAIVDDEPTPATPMLKFANAVTSVAENGGSATVTVVREGPLGQTATVNADTQIAGGDTASAADFTDIPSTLLTFIPGDASETFTVPITNDALDEPNETFTVSLSAATNATIAPPGTAQVQIVDDEATPGALMPLVSVPAQTRAQALSSKVVRYSYSCNRDCTERSVLFFRGRSRGSNDSALTGPGSSSQEIPLNAAARRALRKSKGGPRARLVSRFTDDQGNVVTVTTRFRLTR